MRMQKSDTMHAQRGFTLIELLVVIAIISLLVSILLPSLNRAKTLAKEVVCLTNVKQIGLACMFYANANNDCLPAAYAEYDPATRAAGDSESRYTWMNQLSEFAGEKTHMNWNDHPNYGEYPGIFRGCPEFKYLGSWWLPGYGLNTYLYDDATPPKRWRTNFYVYNDPLPWGGGVPGAFLRRSDFIQPTKVGWLTDSWDFYEVTGDPNQLLYDPTLNLYPGFPNDWGGKPDPSRHGGRCAILYVDGHAQAQSDKVAGWSFSDMSKVQ